MQAHTRDLGRVLAVLGVAGILAMAGLRLAAGRDGWMSDLREWTPRSSLPGLSGPRLHAYFERLQVVPSERRPFRITLQLPAARPDDHLAVEHPVTLPGAGAICLSLLSFASRPAPDVPVTTSPVVARVWVGDELAHARRADADAAGVAIASRRGAVGSANPVVVRLEVAADRAAERASSRLPVAVHFEYLRLRRCGA